MYAFLCHGANWTNLSICCRHTKLFALQTEFIAQDESNEELDDGGGDADGQDTQSNGNIEPAGQEDSDNLDGDNSEAEDNDANLEVNDVDVEDEEAQVETDEAGEDEFELDAVIDDADVDVENESADVKSDEETLKDGNDDLEEDAVAEGNEDIDELGDEEVTCLV